MVQLMEELLSTKNTQMPCFSLRQLCINRIPAGGFLMSHKKIILLGRDSGLTFVRIFSETQTEWILESLNNILLSYPIHL